MVIVINFKNNAKLSLYGGSQKESWNAFIIPIEIKIGTQSGFGCAMFWYPKNIKEFDIQEIPTKIKRIFNRTDLPSPEKPLISFADKEAISVFVSGEKGSAISSLRVIQETRGADFLDKRNRGQQILNALVDQVSTNPLKRSIRLQSLIDSESKLAQQKRQRSGSLAKTFFPDPHDFSDLDYHVPQGFIISVSAIERHLKEHPEIRQVLQVIEDIAYEKVSGDLKDACDK